MEKTRDVGTGGLGIERQRDGENQRLRDRGTVGLSDRGLEKPRDVGT